MHDGGQVLNVFLDKQGVIALGHSGLIRRNSLKAGPRTCSPAHLASGWASPLSICWAPSSAFQSVLLYRCCHIKPPTNEVDALAAPLYW